MYFTKEDYQKIESYLKLNAKRDTDFPTLQYPELDDWVAVVHDGINHKTTMQELGRLVGSGQFLQPDMIAGDIIRDGSIGWIKLDDDLQNIITTIHEVGVGLSTNLGDSDLIGITQRKITEELNNLYAQVNQILFNGAKFSLTVSPNVIFVGDTKNITIKATSSLSADSIVITKYDEPFSTIGTGTSFTITDEIVTDTASVIEYGAKFNIFGMTQSVESNLYSVYPIYYGSGLNVDNFISNKVKVTTAKRSPAGTYNVTVRNDMYHVYFAISVDGNVPQIDTTKVIMGGLEFPIHRLSSTANIEVEDSQDNSLGLIPYYIYESDNTYDATNITIQIQ